MKLDRTAALQELEKYHSPFKILFTHGSLSVEVYRPEKVDLQQPHSRDEAYVIIAGQGDFISGEDRTTFGPGDFLFVPANTIHRFENFSEDFATWVFFYGPEGGECQDLKK